MSFSELTPRSNRKSVAPARTKARRTQEPARHLALWEAIRRTRDELTQWHQRVMLVDGLFQEHIQPRETQLTFDFGKFTDSLMDRYAQNTLGSSNHALLALWISDNLQTLSTHPFASPAQRLELADRWKTLNEHGNFRNTDAQEPYSSAGNSLDDAQAEDEFDEDDVIFDFGLHARESAVQDGNTQRRGAKQKADADAENQGSGAQSSGQEGSAADKAAHDARSDSQNSDHKGSDGKNAGGSNTGAKDTESNAAQINTLQKRLSVDRLFRQLASVLHPDREQDEGQRAVKHSLMSQCLQARKSKDINTLLTLYCEHVGELSDEVSPADHAELITALEMQLRQLQQELRQQHFGDPLRKQIVERYSADNEQQTEQRIQKHAQSLDIEIEQLQAQRERLESEDTLLEALSERREFIRDRMYIDQMTGYSP